MTTAFALPADADSATLVAYLERTPGWVHDVTISGEYPLAYYWFAGKEVDVPLHDEDPQWCAEVAEEINAIAAGLTPATPSV